MLVGGAVVFIYCVLVAGHVPSVKLDSIISTLFSVSLVGIFLMAALIATFIGPAFLWRMADQALEYRKGKAEAGSASPSPIGEQPHSVPEAEVSTEHKKQNFLRAFTWEFLAAQVLIDVSFLLSMVFELSSELTAYFFLGASVLPLLFSKRASTVWLWLANIWRCIDEFWLRLLAVMSSIAPVFIVLLLLQLETNASFIAVGVILQVFYALLYIPILAKPKDNRRQDLAFWAAGIILPTILLMAFTGQKLTGSVLLQTGLGNLTEVVLYVDSEGWAI